ncbi:RidA family protein [Leucobacter sp. CSA1]|uniref:RidA family protein n=1 Tax=Leucobacter chromiisoli TaxID=2796471 RepID=A0A934Q733_9MICO|nr:RidA family protein [Leucobacter chromiisoli]MBK0418648.1 RidA family protein [Leucobacter chromiisoli]
MNEQRSGKSEVSTQNAPTPIAPFSQAVRAGDLVSISGQGPQDPATGAYLHQGDLAAQTRRTLDNIRAIAEAAGGGFDDIVSLRVFLTEREHFAGMNEAYGEYVREFCPSGVFPTRTTIFVTLPHEDMLVEIDALMVLEAR